ncbi:hypothetical protein [Streptomyces sp. NPDC020298]|uniref:hypothetical protein n=1 Tax=unclassified Streptomyces TaxID=2593676 RepID=UPI0033C28D01
MLFSEGPGVCCDIYVEAAPSTVLGLVTDIGVPARLSPELQCAEWLDGADRPALGARFAGYNRHRTVGERLAVSHVVQLREQRVFGGRS